MYEIIREMQLGTNGLIFMALNPELVEKSKWKGLRVEWSFGDRGDNRINVVDSNASMVHVLASKIEVFSRDGETRNLPIFARELAAKKKAETGEDDFVTVTIADDELGDVWQLMTGINGEGFVELFHYGVDYDRGNSPKGAYIFTAEDKLIPIDDHPTEYGESARDLMDVTSAMNRWLLKCGMVPTYDNG